MYRKHRRGQKANRRQIVKVTLSLLAVTSSSVETFASHRGFRLQLRPSQRASPDVTLFIVVVEDCRQAGPAQMPPSMFWQEEVGEGLFSRTVPYWVIKYGHDTFSKRI